MHAKPSFAHGLQTAKMASSRTSAQNNGPRAQNALDLGLDRRLRVHAAFLHLQCANRPFWPLVSKYTNFERLASHLFCISCLESSVPVNFILSSAVNKPAKIKPYERET